MILAPALGQACLQGARLLVKERTVNQTWPIVTHTVDGNSISGGERVKYRLLREGFQETKPCEDLEVRSNAGVWGKTEPGRRSCQCKGPGEEYAWNPMNDREPGESRRQRYDRAADQDHGGYREDAVSDCEQGGSHGRVLSTGVACTIWIPPAVQTMG